MNTREHERLSYLDLARHKARVARRLNWSDLPRFARLVEPRGHVEVELAFDIDEHGYAWATGRAEVEAGVVCHRCAETLVRTLEVDISVCLAADEESATALGAEHEVLVADGPEITVAEIIEDDLILGRPERLCERDPCELTPEFRYPAAGAEQDREANPFSVLAGLKQHRDS